MSRKSHRKRSEYAKKVIARARQIELIQYNFDLPRQAENDKQIAEYINWQARLVGYARVRKNKPIDESWLAKFSTHDLCRWAMHPSGDVFADLLEIAKLTNDNKRACFPGVTPDQVEDRKKLITGVLGRYADYLDSLKNEAGAHPLG